MIKKFVRMFQVSRNKRLFQKNAKIGVDISFSTRSGCVNSGSKENVVIGNHGFCGGVLQALCGGKIEIGNNVYLGSGTTIQAKESIVIGSNVIISNNVLICDNNNHPTSAQKRYEMSQCKDYMSDSKWTWEDADSSPIVIEDNTWIGKEAVILKGVTVGKGSIVALRAVVTRNVPPYSIVAGNPASVVKMLTPIEE